MIKLLREIDVVLSIFNQEKLIERVLYGIFRNTSTPFNLILIFDGCTDRTEKRALKYIKRYKPRNLKNLIIERAPNVYETKANNIGFRLAKNEYMLTLQDDMVIDEYGWEKRLTFPIRRFGDIIAVSSRTAQDVGLLENPEDQNYFINQTSRELGTLPRNVFAVRDTINRGPIAFDMKYLRMFEFLNEDYAPSDLDDADLCLRAWENKKLRCGAFWIKYISDLKWGKARSKESDMYKWNHISKNALKLRKDHKDYIESKIKHSEDIIIEDDEIDYETRKSGFIISIKNILIYPIRINVTAIKDNIKNILRPWKRKKGFVR